MQLSGIWHWVILGCVCYILYKTYPYVASRFFQRAPAVATDLAPGEAERIVDAFEKLPEFAALGASGVVMDEGKLPFPKAKIKAAFLAVLSTTSEEQRQQTLKAGYLLLASFQPGVGREEVSIDFSKTLTATLNAASNLLVVDGYGKNKEMQAKSKREAALLSRELRKAGF